LYKEKLDGKSYCDRTLEYHTCTSETRA